MGDTDAVNSGLRHLQAWFVTGSQHLYGAGRLEQVGEHARAIAACLDEAPEIPVTVVAKPVVTTPDGIAAVLREADSSPDCVGVIAWMHTFSPAKMWIAGLTRLHKPLVHLHTQFNRDLPWAEIDMDFMNLNQSAHGDREFGFIQTRLRRGRKTVVGHWQDPQVAARLGCVDARGGRLARGAPAPDRALRRQHARGRGHRGRQGRGAGPARLLGQRLRRRRPRRARRGGAATPRSTPLVDAYDDRLRRRAGAAIGRRPPRGAARRRPGSRSACGRSSTTAASAPSPTRSRTWAGSRSCPGIGVQRLMADGYGFGAEGDWKTAALVRILKVMGDGPARAARRSWRTTPTTWATRCPRCSARTCSRSARRSPAGRPSCEIHPLSIGGKADPVRLVFDAAPGPGVVVGLADLGDRFRLIANEVDVVEPDAPLPRLPVARAVWRPRPDLPTAAEAWLTAGGPHHTALTTGAADRAADATSPRWPASSSCRSTARRPRPRSGASSAGTRRTTSSSAGRERAGGGRRDPHVRPGRARPADARGHRPAPPARRADVSVTGGLLGRAAAHEPRADAARTPSSSWSRPATSRTSASRPGPRPAATGRSGSCSTGRSRSSTRTSTSGSRASAWELGRAWDDGDRRDGRPGDRPRGGGAARRTATSTRSSRSWRPGASTATSSSATSCTASATSSRRRSPGTGRSATTGCWPWPGAPPTRVGRGPRARRRRRDRRPSRDRDGAGRAVPGDRRGPLPRARAASTSTGAATAGSARGGSAAPTGRTVEPVREARDVAGHAVRQLYLDAGAVDVAVETGDAALLDAVHARWRDMVATRTYLTGGLGSRHAAGGVRRPVRAAARPRLHRDLRGDRRRDARLAAAARDRRPRRGRRDRARRSFNGVLSGVSSDGDRFFYVNPLQRRTHRVAAEPGTGERKPWYACACCPPNLVRTFASWPQVLATTDDDGLQVHQYAAGEIAATVGGGRVRLAIETDYPWSGRVRVTVVEAPADDVDPAACGSPAGRRPATIDWGGGDARGRRRRATASVHATRRWRAGDAVELDLAMPARITEPAPAGRRDPGLRRARARPARLRHRDRRPPRRRRGRGRPPRRGRHARAGRAPRPRTGRDRAVGPGDDRRRRTTRPRGDPLPRVGQPVGRGDAGLDPARRPRRNRHPAPG